MSDEMRMSRAEFEGYINEAFDNGGKAAFHVLRGVIDELEARFKTLEGTYVPPTAPLTPVQPPADHGDGSGAGGRSGGEGA